MRTGRRGWRKAGGVLAAAGVLLAGLGARAAEAPPNVVLLVADDLGWHDVGYHGGEIRTPVLDRLAREGVQLDRYYVYPSCSPTRACLFAGRNAARYGIPGPLGVRQPLALPGGVTTLPELLRERGYATGLVGKWHLGDRPDALPRRQGFDSYYGYLHGQVDQYTHESISLEPIWLRNEETIREEGHATDLFAREAAAFIQRHRARPFFLSVTFSVPHYPLQEDPERVRAYADRIPDPERRLYAAMVTHMDEAIGRVLAALDDTGARRNTLVLFVSDNGGQRDWLRTGYGGKHGPYRRLGDNTPLRGWKTELYEGGVRVLGLAHWPGKLRPGVLRDVTHACDLFPTVAAVTGAPAPASLRLEGRDQWPALSGSRPAGEAPPPRTFHWNIGSHVGIRSGDYKLTRRVRDRPPAGQEAVELFDLEKDPLETRSLAATEPERVRALTELLDAELRQDQRELAAGGA